MENDHIKKYWESQGQAHGESHWASWGDNWAIDLEIGTIGKYIDAGQHVLDVGCANGHGTLIQYQTHRPASIVGIDFAESMISAANKAKEKHGFGNELSFEEGDIRKLRFNDGKFDLVYTTRVLINLPTWEDQKRGILECLRVVRPGGIALFSEGFWEPLVLLNAIRTLKALPPLVEHDFNRYLKMSALEEFIQELGYSYTIEDFSSIYYLGSRFLRELVTNPADHSGYSNPINKLFYEIEKDFSGGGFGIQQAVVVRKS